MKNLLLVIALITSYTFATAQVAQIDLEQVPGEFTTTSLSLEEGDYQFNISNNAIDHQVGFVLVPAGKYAESDHIKSAYVSAPVSQGEKAMSSVVSLAAGEYEYFCPMNPTPKYSLTIHEEVETIELKQTPGEFTKKNVEVSEGVYKFEIHNDGVDHEVGFVLVPAGKYGPENHIKAAYVKAPVADGTSEETNILQLTAGQYEYFCPLNPTEKHSLTVTK